MKFAKKVGENKANIISNQPLRMCKKNTKSISHKTKTLSITKIHNKINHSAISKNETNKPYKTLISIIVIKQMLKAE